MARRRAERQLSGVFRRDPILQHFYLDGVVPTGETLGVGSYGAVVEVKYKNIFCAAKQMHELLLDAGNEGVRETIEKYQRECQLIASLRHPNITQFLGLCFLEGSRLPLMVMEQLEMSVDDLLEGTSSIPLPVKLSILTDTCCGLVYLHGMKTPIIHRDLTARNVLLTSSLSAKIADLGNSRIVSLSSGQLAQTLSRNPGTAVYMAPEALSDSHRYGPSLDVFSFGHLSLYTLTQVFPGDLLAATQVDTDNPGRVSGRTEVERRSSYMSKLEHLFCESLPILVQLVSQCLDNDPQTRPTSEEILGRLKVFTKDMEVTYGGNLERMLEVATTLVVKEMSSKNKRIVELQDSEARLEAEVEELLAASTGDGGSHTINIEEVSRLASEKQDVELEKNRLETEKIRLETDNTELKATIIHLESENERLEAESDRLEAEKNVLKTRNVQFEREISQITTKTDQIETDKCILVEQNTILKSENCELSTRLRDHQKLVEEKLSLEEIVKQLKMDLEAAESPPTRVPVVPTCLPKPVHSLKPKSVPLSLNWIRGQNMTYSMSGFIQAVEVDNIVYVGGGDTDGAKGGNPIVMAYYTMSSKWYSLPRYHSTYFSMTVFNRHLVLVGGYRSEGSYSREIGVWRNDIRKWWFPYSPMVTGRRRPSSTDYKQWLVVAGGATADGEVHKVEIFDVNTNQWSMGPSTPSPLVIMKTAVIRNVWYLVGINMSLVYCVSLDILVTQQTSMSSNMWQQLSPLDVTSPCLLNCEDSLLAVGGINARDRSSTSAIVSYEPETGTWIPVGNLPRSLHHFACITVLDKVYVFGGLDGSNQIKAMHYTNLCRF